MKLRAFTLVLVLSVGLLALSACGLGVQKDVPTPTPPAPTPTAEAPEGAIAARNAVVAFLRTLPSGQAPEEGAAWQAERTTPDGLVGSESYEFSSGNWTVDVSYPVVAPDQVVYTVQVANASSGFTWEGQVDASGSVTASESEPSEETVDGWTGIIVQLPAGNQFGQYFEREDGEQFDIGGANDGAQQLIAQFRGTGTVVKVWGTLYIGVPASEARHIEADRIEAQPEGQPVEGWIGTIVQLPPGNQFGQYFERDDGEQFGIGGTTDALRQQISELRGSGAQIQVWGTLYTGVPATEARQIEVTRIEILAAPGADTADGWTGTIVKLPPGNQFGQYFLRADGEKYGIDGATDDIRQQISDLRWTGAQIKVWGVVEYGVPAAEARHITADRIEVVSGAATDPRDLSPFAFASASSTLLADRSGTYNAFAAIDGALETSWAEGVDGPGIGESITLTFPQPVLLHHVGIDVGFDKDENLFYANNRVKAATLIFSDGSQLLVSFSDARGLQEIPLVRAPGGPIETTSVQLVIDDVYPGSRYNDTCIAEFQVWGTTK